MGDSTDVATGPPGRTFPPTGATDAGSRRRSQMTRATHVLSSMRRLPALALVAAALAGGMTLSLPQTHA